MNQDLLTPPPPGHSTVFALPVLATSGGAPDLTGLVLAADGRLTVAVQGAGLSVRLDALDCSALAMILIQLADRLADGQQTPADAAMAALERVVPAGTA